MKNVQLALIPLMLLAFIAQLQGGGRVDGMEARMVYEPHFDLNSNYELPPILVEFKHLSGAGVTTSLLDLTNGAPVQVMLPYFRTQGDPLAKFSTPTGGGTNDVNEDQWGIAGTYVNVLTFDASASSNVSITGNAATSFDVSITASNFFQQNSVVGDLNGIRSTSYNYLPTGRYLRQNTTNDFAGEIGADIHKGSTFFINRKTSTFIGYDNTNPPAETPYIVITGLRVWTVPFGDFALSTAAVENGTNGWTGGFHCTLNTDVRMVTSFDNSNGAYRMVLRVSDDDTALHWLGQKDEDSAGNEIYYDATPFENKFYVGGPRVSVYAPSNFNLFTELSKPLGAPTAFPNISFFLPSGRITADGGALTATSIQLVSYDSLTEVPGPGSTTWSNSIEWNFMASKNAKEVEIRITLPGADNELLFTENSSAVTLTSNLYTWNNLDGVVGGGMGQKDDRALQLCSQPTTLRTTLTNQGKSVRLKINSDQMFLKGQKTNGGFWGGGAASMGGNQNDLAAPFSHLKDGPLSTGGDMWSNGNNIMGDASNGGTDGRISEAITISGLQVENFVSPINPNTAGDLNLNASNVSEPSRLYSQLGLQIFNDVNVPVFFKGMADDFVMVSGGPSMNVSADALTTIPFVKSTADADRYPLALHKITIVHDQDDWVNKDDGLKLSFKPNSGLFFLRYVPGGTRIGPGSLSVTVDTSNPVTSTVAYADLQKTMSSSRYGDPSLDALARSVVISMPTGAVYEADIPVVIGTGLLVTYDPTYVTGGQGWPQKQYIEDHQGTNGAIRQSLVGNLMLMDKRHFGIDTVLGRSDSNIVLANLVRADNTSIVPNNLALRSMRDRFFSTFDHVEAQQPNAYQINAVSMDTAHLVFENTFSSGDMFIHLTSQANGRVGIGTYDSTKTNLHFAGSASSSFNKVDISYGSAGRYVRIRREFIATINEGDDLVISGLRYFPSDEKASNRITVGYPDASNLFRLANVTDSRIYTHQNVHMWIDRPVLLNPRESVSHDMILPFPDIYVSHDARQEIAGVNRQDNSGDLRFVMPGAREGLKWNSDFSRVVYYFTTRDRVNNNSRGGDHTFGSDGSYWTNNASLWTGGVVGSTLVWQPTAANAKALVATYIDTDILPGNQGGVGIGIRAVEDDKILGIDVVNEWPIGSTMRVAGVLMYGLDFDNSENMHITNNIPTYASLGTGTSGSLDFTTGKVIDNGLMGHLGLNYRNDDIAQSFAQEPVYVSGPVFVAKVQGITWDAGTTDGMIDNFAENQNNLNKLYIEMHEETDFEVETIADNVGFARGITSDGIRLTFAHESPLRFLTADTACKINNVQIEPLYENIDRSFPSGSAYGGFARTVYLRFLYPDGGGGEVDVWGFRQGIEKIGANVDFEVKQLTVTNIRKTPVPEDSGATGATAYTGYFPARPGNKGDWRKVDFGRKWRTPGLMLSASSAGVVDAYLYDGLEEAPTNGGSSGGGGSTPGSGASSGSGSNNNIFNACLIGRTNTERDDIRR